MIRKITFLLFLTAATLYTAAVLAATPEQEREWHRRTDSLLGKMTLREKIGQLNMLSGNWTATGPVLQGTDQEALLREGRLGAMLNITGCRNTRMLQQTALSSRLGIPLLFGQDVIHGYKTIFPVPLAQAASFDPEAVEAAARVAARETAVSGIQWVFSPMLDVARDPRWGRVMEGPGEDPHVASEMARAMIRGYERPFADGLEVMACAKHFAAYGGAIGGRDYNTVDVSMQTLHNFYLPPFRAAAEAGAGSFMCSFNEINGVPASADKYLYDLLYGEWGFDGIVVSDWGSIREMVVHGYSRDRKQAAEQAINAGVTIDMESRCCTEYLEELVAEGAVSEATVDNAVRRVLMQKFRMGLFDDPFRYCDDPVRERREVLSEANLEVSRDMARKSIVLLRNEGGLLPLTAAPRTIAVVGPLADSKRDMDGNWVMSSLEPRAVTLLEALRERYPQAVIRCERGCGVTGDDRSGFAAAERAARGADLVVLALGETWNMSGEARSRGDISLPGVQEELAMRIYAANPRSVTLLMGGRPMIFEQIAAHAPAVLYCWWLGSGAGRAMTDVLTGDYNPSARLPMTFPSHLGQIPVYYNHKNSGRPANDGGGYSGRYLDIGYKPRYPFAYGLSYTTFRYDDVRAETSGDGIRVRLRLTNTGSREGRELVQVYVRKRWGETTRPVRELKAFRQVALAPGESREVVLDIPRSDLRYYGAGGWQSGAGDYCVIVGRDAADTRAEVPLTLQ